MQFLIPVSHLRAAFAVLAKVCLNRSTLPVLHNLKFERVENRLVITATDLDRTLSFTHQIEPDPITPLAVSMAKIRWPKEAGSMLVPRSSVQTVVKAARDGMVAISETCLEYRVAGTPIRLPFESCPVKDFPEPAEPVVEAWSVLDSVHRESMLAASRFASTDEGRYVLNGVYLESEGNDRAIVGTDGRRLYVRPAPALRPLERSCILPSANFAVLGTPTFAALDWHFGLGKAETAEYGVITAGPWRLVTKLIEGNYPNYRQVIPAEQSEPPLAAWATAAIARKAHETLIHLLGNLPPSEKGRTSVALQFHADRLGVKCGTSFSEFSVPGIRSNAPIAVVVDREFLLDGLTIGPGVVHLCDGMAPIVYRSGDAQYVLMPMRGEAPAMNDPELAADVAKWEGKQVQIGFDEPPLTGTVVGGARRGLLTYAEVRLDDAPGLPRQFCFSSLRAVSAEPEVQAVPQPKVKSRRGKALAAA